MVSIRDVLPDEHNIIILDPELKDHNGIPAPGIDYRLSENSRNMLNFSIARAMEVLEAAGAIKLRSTSNILGHPPQPHPIRRPQERAIDL
ncbi:MAG: hypothetical protein OXC41_07195 [Gammaproteobacteria bacterium]|nr:hypothetical protein [Gammaproteobacteria bacterium]